MLEGEAGIALETATKAQGGITAKQPALATLDEAAAKSAEAAAKLAGDAAVAAAAAAVKAKADALRADYVKLEKAAIDAKARAESAARQVQIGDILIIMAYAWMTPEEAKGFKPLSVYPDEHNKIKF
jgi:hypothetical protein